MPDFKKSLGKFNLCYLLLDLCLTLNLCKQRSDCFIRSLVASSFFIFTLRIIILMLKYYYINNNILYQLLYQCSTFTIRYVLLKIFPQTVTSYLRAFNIIQLPVTTQKNGRGNYVLLVRINLSLKGLRTLNSSTTRRTAFNCVTNCRHICSQNLVVSKLFVNSYNEVSLLDYVNDTSLFT